MFTDAKYGDCYKTRDGRKALYITTFETDGLGTMYRLSIEDSEYLWDFRNDGSLWSAIDKNYDIVGKWENGLSPENLKRLDEIKLDYCGQEGYTYEEDESDDLIGWRTKEKFADEICQAIAYGFEQGIKNR